MTQAAHAQTAMTRRRMNWGTSRNYTIEYITYPRQIAISLSPPNVVDDGGNRTRESQLLGSPITGNRPITESLSPAKADFALCKPWSAKTDGLL
jgi:hypothetical protein